MKKIIKLTESDLHRIVKEAVNEISLRKADNVSYLKGHEFKELKDMFEPFIRNLMYHYEGTDNKYINEIIKHAEAINSILDKKVNQADNIAGDLQYCTFDNWAEKNPNYTDDDEYFDAQVGDIIGDKYYKK